MRNTAEKTDRQRLQEIETKLSHFYDPDFCESTQLIGIVGEAFLTYLDKVDTKGSTIQQHHGEILTVHLGNLRELLTYLDAELFPH